MGYPERLRRVVREKYRGPRGDNNRFCPRRMGDARDTSWDVEEPADAIDWLTKEEQFVFKPLRQNTGGAVRRVIHGDATKLPDSPFEEPNTNSTEIG